MTTATNINEILDDLSTIGMNVFKDDLGTLKTLIISYHYVRSQLQDENMDPNFFYTFRKQEKVLGSRIFDILKSIESDCTTQLWMNEDYDDPLLLETRKNTEEIKKMIKYYRWRHVHNDNDDRQLVRFSEKLLRKIKRMGVEIMATETENIMIKDLDIDI